MTIEPGIEAGPMLALLGARYSRSCSAEGVSCSLGRLMKRAQNNGTTVMATANDANSDMPTASAKAENR